ncbi:MAG: flagellar FliL protein [Gammaproteobacteria bacterium]|jgi:flagellar FliL protein
MADDIDEDGKDQAGTEPAGGSKKKLIIIIIGALLVIGAAVGGTLFILGFFDGDSSGDEDVAEVVDENVIDKPSPAIYFPIKPSFIINFQSRGRQRYLQTDVILMTRDPAMFTGLQEHLPLIKNKLVMLFGGEVYEELQTDEGRELLRQKALEAVKEITEQELGKSDIEQILFTNFVMQ